jgi:1-deoxy-D-xylulose-5-phosphate reductoisomerase
MRRVLILGSTGSIGKQALDVIERNNELIAVGLSAATDHAGLLEQARKHRVETIALADPDAAALASEQWDEGTVFSGHEGIIRLIVETECDIVLNAIVGSAGLGPTVATLGDGIDLALANKESLVVGGDLVMQLAEGTGAQLIPVDSEHSALYQLVNAEQPGTVDRLVLTASGGPFRGRTREELADVSIADALAHPTWDMGGKISIDSATMMNKGLEIIEAHHLFGLPYDQIDAVIHPQSIIHSLIDLNDGATMAHLGYPDMRVPISYALNFPARTDVPVERLDLAQVGSLTFEEPDREAFRCLALAEAAGRIGGSAPCVMNAANEEAVAAFLAGEIPFLAIPEVIEQAMDAIDHSVIGHFSQLADIDVEARVKAREAIAETVLD